MKIMMMGTMFLLHLLVGLFLLLFRLGGGNAGEKVGGGGLDDKYTVTEPLVMIKNCVKTKVFGGGWLMGQKEQ